jgi:hypothetical protein
MTTPKVHIGSISHGTLRTQDLLPAFIDELQRLGGTLEYVMYMDIPANQILNEDDPFWQSEDAMWDMEALTDALQECCPPFVYFGAHPGDGSDFGFWPDMDTLNMAIQEAEASGDPSNGDDQTLSMEGIIVQVNDHGNVTVMDLDRNELWSVV